MIVFNGFKLIGLAVMIVILVLCIIVNIIDRIICTIKKHQQSRIDAAYTKEDK